MTIADLTALAPGERDQPELCAVCATPVEGTEIEDTSGWRWFSDGRGGLLPLCPTCPVPATVSPGE